MGKVCDSNYRRTRCDDARRTILVKGRHRYVHGVLAVDGITHTKTPQMEHGLGVHDLARALRLLEARPVVYGAVLGASASASRSRGGAMTTVLTFPLAVWCVTTAKMAVQCEQARWPTKWDQRPDSK